MPDHDRHNSSQDNWRNRDEDNWAEQVNWEPRDREYNDYGWERGQSVLPEFRDPSVHLTDQERERLERRRDREEQLNRRGSNRMSGKPNRGPYAGVGPKNYRRSDSRIMEDVCQRLTDHPAINAADIQINVQDGEVTLEGMVDSRRTKRLTEDVIENITGVKDVHNRLRVQPVPDYLGSGNTGMTTGPGGDTTRGAETSRVGEADRNREPDRGAKTGSHNA